MNGHSKMNEIDDLKHRMNSLEEILKESLKEAREIQKERAGKNK
jgi:hypothetical protein